MIERPQYAENIIVAVVVEGEWSWYVTTKDIWVMDQVTYEQAFDEAGYDSDMLGDYSDRFDIPVLDTNTAGRFLAHIQELRVKADELEAVVLEASEQADPGDWYGCIPSLLIDFDRQRLYSLYPELIRFEEWVPKGWIGTHEDFLPLVPPDQRYWIVDGRDLFKQLSGEH